MTGRAAQRGTTLVELLVVLVIISTLAVVAMPFAERSWQRKAERELRQTLREVRTAIDRFHADASAGVIETDGAASETGYPITLEVLVEGVAETDGGARRRYLRRLPINPFAPKEAPPDAQWILLGYADPPGSGTWNGEDVFDLRPRTERQAIDGSAIADW